MVVEEDKSSSNSDRDKQMMNSFESLSDKSDKKESKDKKKKKDSPFSFLPKAEVEETKPEQRGSFFEPKKEKLEKLEEKSEEIADDHNPEMLDETETILAAEQYTDLREEELKQELAAVEPDTPEEAAALANAALIEAVEEKLQDAETVDDELLDEALEETAEELELPLEATIETDEPDEEDEPVPVAAAAGGSGTTPPPPPTPQVPPVPPAGRPVPPLPPIGGGGTPPAAPPSPNTVPTNPNVLPPPHQRGADMLVGGILGYLLGRRRGRIKTEARLLPVQEKLEQEVKSLHDKIAEREDRIRILAAQKAAESPEPIAPTLVEKIQARRLERKPAAEIAPQPKVQPERLASVIIPKPEIQRPPKTVETLTVPELLEVAQRIEIEGTTLKRMYEVGRIDVIGVRRVVKEYLHERNDSRYEKRLFENLRPVEANPEFLANQQAASDDSTLAGAGTAATAAQSAASPVAANDPSKVPIMPSVMEMRQKQQARQQQTAIAAIIAILIGLAIIFLVVK